MKKILTRIFSVMLIAAVTLTPAFAETAKKLKAAPARKAQSAVTMKAQKKGKAAPLFSQAKTRKAATKGLNTAKTGKLVAPTKRANKAIAREGVEIPQLYGTVVYTSDMDAPLGLEKLQTTADGTPVMIAESVDASYGGVCIDDTYYCVYIFQFWGMLFGFELQTYDIATGELTGFCELPEEELPLWYASQGMAFDPATGTVYGIAFDENGAMPAICQYSLDVDDPSVTVVTTINDQFAGIAFDAQGQMYGIRYDKVGDNVAGSTLCKINKANGEVTEIGETGLVPNYIGGVTIDPKSGRMFWNLNPESGSYMCEVNLETGAATVLWEFENEDEIVGLSANISTAVPGSPEACEDLEASFEADSLTGSVTCTAPAEVVGGGAGEGSLKVTLQVNGEEYASQDVAWGAEVAFNNVTVPEAGKYNFTVYATNAVGDGTKKSVKNVWVGADTPEATEASLRYENGNMEVVWVPVLGTVNGGYMNIDNLTYTVKDWNGDVVAEGLTVNTFTQAVAEPEDITSYYYTVYAVCDGLVSAPARTNVVVLGSIVPPYESDFENDGLAGWTILDSNGDERTWEIEEGLLKIGYNSSEDMDDWAITPPIKMQGGMAYGLTFSAWAQSDSYPEQIEVMIAKEPTAEAMLAGDVIVETTVVTMTEPLDFDDLIPCKEDGVYFIGFHGVSQADMYYMFLSDITISEAVSGAVPGQVDELMASPNPNGELKCEVSFKAPERTLSDGELTSITKIEVMRGGEVVKTFNNPAPGSLCTFEDSLEEGGYTTYSVIATNEEGSGKAASVTVFVGFAEPSAPFKATVKGTDVLGQAVVEWSEVYDDINGLPLPSVTYDLYTWDESGAMKALAEGLTTTSYTYQAVAEGDQQFVQCVVFAVHDGEMGEGTATNMLPLGTPYNGIYETLQGGLLHYEWAYEATGNGQVVLFDHDTLVASGLEPLGGEDDAALAIYGSYPGDSALLMSGLISLDKAENPGVSFYSYNIGEDDENMLRVFVREQGQEEWTQLFENEVSQIGEPGEWTKITLSLDQYTNKTVQVAFEGEVLAYAATLIDNIKVGAMLAEDLAASSISAPAKAMTGTKFDVTVVVDNLGTEDADSYSVELYMDNELVQTKECGELASSLREKVTFECEMSPIATEDLTFYAKVIYAGDQDMTNNQTSSVTVAPVISKLPAPSALEGSVTTDGIKLEWAEPVFEGVSGEVTEDFEDAEAFSAEYGDWTFVDGDDSEVGGFQGTNIPGITPGGTKGSFWIWDADQLGNETFAAHSGSKYLFALFRYDDGTTDDWAISPLLNGEAQTISFFAKSYSSSYPEKIAVYASTGSLDPADFTLVEGTEVAKVPNEWTEYTAELPAGTKHFAIRSYATGSFMLMIDDVTYSPAAAGEGLELAGYNIYRDGVKINEAPVQETSYVDGNVEEGNTYTYVVTAVYTDKGESAGSNELTLEFSAVKGLANGQLGIYAAKSSIVVVNAEGREMTVSAANGAIIFSGKAELNTVVSVEPGVYVVKVGKEAKKVVVR